MSWTEKRRDERSPFRSSFRLSWQDSSGRLRVVRADALDRSRRGLAVEASEAVEVRRMIQVEMDGARRLGLASVRHCRRKGLRFLVGLEFSPGFRW